MYASIEHALYRAFNVSELFYQKNCLADLYQAPDWENQPVHDEESLTNIERIHEDCKVYRLIRKRLSQDSFHVLRIVYCRSLDIKEWRLSLRKVQPVLLLKIGRIKFNPKIYEYTCIKQLTGNKMKELYIKNESARRNSKRVCAALSEITEKAHNKAEHILMDYGILRT